MQTVFRTGAALQSLIAAAFVWSTQAAAQDPAGRETEAAAVGVPTAPVVVDGATLFRVRGVSAYPADRRAAEIADRIKGVASDRTVPVGSITIQDTPTATFVVAPGRRIFAVFDADAQLEGVPRQVLAEAYRGRATEAVQAYRRDREPRALAQKAGRAVVATAVFIVVIAVGRRAIRRFRTFVDQRYRPRFKDVQFSTIEIVRGEQLWSAVQNAVAGIATLAGLVAGYFYLDYILLLFPWTRALGLSLTSIILRPLATLGTGFLRIIPDVVFLVILALVTRFVLRLIKGFFRRVAAGAITLRGFETEWALPAERIARFVIIAFALVTAYPYIPGSGSEAFKGIGLIIGLMFSLGSPSLVGNLIAGLSLAFRRAFRVGDRVRIGDFIGDVMQVRLLTTYLRSPKNEQLVIPNSLILNSEVVNYTTFAKEPGVILHTNVGIGYETPWRQVEAMLLEAARRTPGLLSEPEPFVFQKRLGDFAVDYEINAYCDNPRRMMPLYAALHRSILDVFNEYGVQIMTPAYEGDPERPKVVPREQWYTAPARPDGTERVVEVPVAADAGVAADARLTTGPVAEGRRFGGRAPP